MTKILQPKYFLVIISAIVIFGFSAFAYANPLYEGSSARSAAATTTVSYLLPGVATSTSPLYDSYEQSGTNEKNGGNFTIPDSVAILLQGVASSSSSVMNIACEFSDDNVDWYQNEIYPATTTSPQNVSAPATFTFTYASTTIGGVVRATNIFSKLVECPVPLRYVRAVITDTGAGFSIWSSIVPLKQRN